MKMGRRKQNNVYKYFEVSKTILKSKCLVCNKDLNSINSSNLIKHLKIHPTEYEEVKALNIKKTNSTKKSVNSEIVIKECTNLVTVHGRPLAILDDTAFQKILSLIPDCNTKISSRNIRENIIETAGELRLSMAREIQNKMLCIKIDIASLSLRSFMGINVQYLEEGIIVLKNLAMIELLERHTSEYLKEQVLYVLQRFRIPLENIYSFTTDNGANMLKMSRLLNEEAVDKNQLIPSKDINDVAMTSLVDDIGIDIQTMESIDSIDTIDTIDTMNAEDLENMLLDAECDIDFDYDTDTGLDIDREQQYVETLTSLLSVEFHESTTHTRNIAVVRCAAHTLQLSVLEICNDKETKQAIGEARRIAKQLRTQIYAAEISKAGKNQSILDCPTRWNSTVDMLERLISLKDFCDNTKDNNLKLPESTWNRLQEYVTSLIPAKQLMKVLQQEQLTIGDYYLEWLLCKIKLKTINTDVSNKLLNCMEKREPTLMNNDAFLCAILLDGRLSSTLCEDQRHNAKLKLLDLHQHLQNLNKNKENIPPCSTASSTSILQTNDSARTELDDFLSVKYVEAQSDVQTIIRRRNNNMHYEFGDVSEELTDFLREPLLKSTDKILKYWELNKNKYPRLYKLACVALASPATQVSVERLFSSLKFVVSKYRLNLKSSLIEDIIFIRNNQLYKKRDRIN